MARSLLSGLLRPAPFGPGDDPDTAPWALPGSPTDLPYRWRRVRPNLLLTYLVGIVFLVFAIPTIADGVGPVGLGLRIGYLVVLAVAYVGAAWTADAPLRVRWCYVAGFTGLVFSGALLWGWEFANFGVYPAILMATLIPWHQARFALVGWALVLAWRGSSATCGCRSSLPRSRSASGSGWRVGWRAAGSGACSSTARPGSKRSRWPPRRARISRDLHDILGHSLTAITIKSSLAARLADTEPAAAKEEMAAVEAIARQALADVRATVSGLTEIRLATEIASARSVLLAAGIEARTPVALPTLSDAVSELFGYVVRESVTNVVRHAEATRCVIEVDEHCVEVRDDGVGLGTDRSGRGLTGLARTRRRRRRRVRGRGRPRRRHFGPRRPRPVAPADPERAMIRVLVADDQAIIAEALAALLRTEPDLEVVALADSAPESVRRAAEVASGRRADGRADARHGRLQGRHRGHRGDRGRPPRGEGHRPDHLRPPRIPATRHGGRSRRVHGEGRLGRPTGGCHPAGLRGTASRRPRRWPRPA